MSATTRLIEKAITLSRQGCKADARRLLIAVLRTEPANSTAWFWYADTFEDRAGKIAALEEFLNLDPNNLDARLALHRLKTESAGENTSPPPPAVSAAPSHLPARPSGSFRAPLWLMLLGFLLFGLAGARLATYEYGDIKQRYQVLAGEKETLQSYLSAERTQHAALQIRFDTLTGERDALDNQLAEVQSLYTALQQEHSQLQNDHDRLGVQYSELQNQQAVLQQEYDTLAAGYNQLTSEYTALKERSLEPPYIFIHDRQVDLSFYRSNRTIWGWNIPFDSLENSILRGSETRKHMPVKRVNTKQGDVHSVYDFSVFVEPEIFTTVMASLYQDSADPDTFIHEVWYIITQLSN